MEKAFLIEFKDLYLGFSCNKITWVTADNALRFAREIDAENFKRYALVANPKAKVTEHSWIDNIVEEIKIDINGEWIHIKEGSIIISYEKICELAGIKPEYTPTVAYSTKWRQGTLVRGKTVVICDGMIIDCIITGAA